MSKSNVVAVNSTLQVEVSAEWLARFQSLVTEKITLESVVSQCVRMGYYNMKHRRDERDAYRTWKQSQKK